MGARKRLQLAQAATLGILLLALEACSGQASICAAEGRELSEAELIENAVPSIQARRFDSPQYDSMTESQKQAFEQFARNYLIDLKKTGEFLDRFPHCCRIIAPEEVSIDGVPSESIFTRNRHKIYRGIEANYSIPYAANDEVFVVPVQTRFFINNCGTTTGVGESPA